MLCCVADAPSAITVSRTVSPLTQLGLLTVGLVRETDIDIQPVWRPFHASR